MEIIQPNEGRNRLEFNADGWEFLGICILNWVLTTITFGLYYPWARVAKLRFIYQNTSLNETPFVFTGNGKELFKGFIKVYILIVILYIVLFTMAFKDLELLNMLMPLIVILISMCIIPLAIHGALRYRLSRTSWRGIHFGYRGERSQLLMDFILGYILTAFTFGIYSAWFITSLRTYIIGNCRFGSVRFGYDGKGGDLFIINLKGFIFSFLTFGIYYFWYMKNWMNYFASNTYLEQNENRYYLNAYYSGGDYFALAITNALIVIFTLGLGSPFAVLRTVDFILNHIEIPAEIDFERLSQTEDDFADATGEEALDFLDLGII